VKPVVEENGGETVLKISLAQPGSDPVTVRAKPSTLVSKLVAAYAQSANISASAFRLVTSEGDRMAGDKTLAHYGVQDGDQVDVVIEQTGGGM